MNLSAAGSAELTLDLYPQDGGAPLRPTVPSLGPGANYNVYLPAQSMLQSGAYAGLTQGTLPFGQLARSEWPASGAAALYESPRPGTDVVLPWAVRGQGGAVSLVTIQNTDPGAAAAVTATWHGPGGPVARVLQIGPGTSVSLDFGTEEAFQASEANLIGYIRSHANSKPHLAELGR